jgi:DGQHR domain-containing protein
MKLDSRGRIALIEMDGGAMAYAVDGQHRLLGIMAVNDLLKEGFLTIRNKDRKETGMEQKGELLARYGLTLAELEKFRTEMVGIEFIAAVMEGETYEEARRRIRSIFVHVNKTAKPLSAGEIAILDEDDGFAIVARQVALDYPLFKKDRPGDRVNWKSNALPAGGLWLTTVSTLREMTKDYLQGRMPFRKWLPSRKDEIPVRPGDDELMPGEDEMTELWDYIGTLPVFEDIKSGGEIDEWREFHDKGGRGHLLMRPVGQQALALAVGRLHQSEAGPNLPLETIFAKLRRFDKDGGFEQDRPSSAWFGITYEPTRGRMVTGSENLGALMLEYLINGLDEDGRKDLLEAYRLRRWTAAEDGQEFGLNFDGKQVTDREAIQLPPLI